MQKLKQTRNGLLAFLVMLWGGLAWAAGGGEDQIVPDKPEIEQVQEVIASQLLAFQSSDGAGA